MCGNGIRCLARYVHELTGRNGEVMYTIETGAGKIVPTVRADGLVTVDMGTPRLNGPDVPTTLTPTKGVRRS